MNYISIKEAIKDFKDNPAENHADIYHKIPFSEFDILTTSTNFEEVQKKLSWIIEWTSKDYKCFDGLKVLDIGANAGFFSLSLAKKGAEVKAFEPHKRYSDLAKFIAKEKKLNLEWHNSGFDPSLIQGQEFDICLMLSVFQWMAKAGDEIDTAAKNLLTISNHCKMIFFELSYNKGTSALTTNKANHYSELIAFLRKNTRYSSFKLIGITKLYKNAPRYFVLCSNKLYFDDNLFRKILRSFNF